MVDSQVKASNFKLRLIFFYLFLQVNSKNNIFYVAVLTTGLHFASMLMNLVYKWPHGTQKMLMFSHVLVIA